MILYLQQCKQNMNCEEKRIYASDTATDYLNYIYNSFKFQSILTKMVPNKSISEEEWKYVFEKLYLVTHKAMQEEASPKFLDGLTYLVCRLGLAIHPKNSSDYNDCYEEFERIRSVYRSREVNDILLKALTEAMESKSKEDFQVLLQMHKEASMLRKNRDSLYEEMVKSKNGEITDEEVTAINSFNHSYEKEKELVLVYKSVL